MCVNCRYIYNRYSRRHVLVKCGKCPACFQEKAMKRANRIRNHSVDGQLCLFVTLTYTNDYVPYIRKSDVFNDSCTGEVSIYRRCSIRQIYDRHSDVVTFKKSNDSSILGSVSSFEVDLSNCHLWKSLNGFGDSDCYGVCWYSDIQDFYKRLRQNLVRKYHYEKKFAYFSCSEVGSITQRPHFHLLLFIPREDEALFRSAICEAWPYADKTRTNKYVEIARDAANYVASYVNSHTSLSSTCAFNQFMQKHSHSKNFGVVLDCFSLRSVLQKIESGDLCYYRRTKFDGSTDVSPLPIPLYVLYRYFPVCKGFSWLSACQLRSILLDPEKVGDILTDFSFNAIYKRDVYDYNSDSHSLVHGLSLVYSIPIRRCSKLINPVYHFTPKETYQIYVRLYNCQKRFIEETGLSLYDYVFYYERVYNVYKSMLLKLSHSDITLIDDYSDFYENAFEVFANPAIAPTLTIPLQLDPNKREDIVQKTEKYLSLYDRLDKQKKVTNYVMEKLGHAV